MNEDYCKTSPHGCTYKRKRPEWLDRFFQAVKMSTLDKGCSVGVADAKVFFEKELKKLHYEIFYEDIRGDALFDHLDRVFKKWGIE